MLRVIFILFIGIALGYAYGFADAREHAKPLTTRISERLAGETARIVEEHPAATGSTRAALRHSDNPR